MIALDLSPLVSDPRRGVARALHHLLLGLARVPRDGVALLGLCPGEPRVPPEVRAALPAACDGYLAAGGPDSLRVRRRTLVRRAERAGARVLLSPWAAFPATRMAVVAWIHEVPFVRHGALEGRWRAWRHERATVRALETAARVVVPSEAVRADVLRLAPASGRDTPRVLPAMIPHGFDPAPWAAATARPGEPPYALLVGTGEGAGGGVKKGVDLFHAALRLPALRGLAGRTVGDGRASLSDAALRSEVASARVVAVPSRSEGFGFPMLEAFAAGVPVVAAAAGSLPEVSGGAAHLVPPGDVFALADGLGRVHRDEALRAELVAAGRRRATEFPVEAFARAWLETLRDTERRGGAARWPA